MLGLRAWSDDLVVVLFEFLEDDTKLAQSCTDWLYVQHWYTVVPDPAMRVTLWALTGAGGNCHEHMQDTPPHFFDFLGFHLQEVFAMDRFVSKRSSAHVLRSFAISYCFLAVILDQKSLAAVGWLPRRGRRFLEASLVQLSHKIHSHGFAFPYAVKWDMSFLSLSITRPAAIAAMVLASRVDHGVQHVCKFLYECLDMCTTGNRP